MNIREMRTLLGDTQSEFAARYNIPFRTVQNIGYGFLVSASSEPKQQNKQE